MNQGQIIRIGLGSCCIEIQCQDQEFMAKMLINYHPFLVSRQPEFRINFKLKNTLTESEVKQLLTSSRAYVDGNHFVITPEILEFRIDWAEATLQVDTERELFAPSVEYQLMNPLLRGIYSGIYTKIRHTKPDAYLVHGCGIVDGKQCYLFTGPSGSGKTTLARLAEGRKVLNDEAVLIGRNQEGFLLSGTPFDGGIPDKCNDSGQLSAIIFLKHDTQVSLRRLSRTQTYYKLLTQIFDTSPLFETPVDDSLQERADLSAKMATEVPSYELGFRPDSSFWQAIESI
jgi:hypothetical protein